MADAKNIYDLWIAMVGPAAALGGVWLTSHLGARRQAKERQEERRREAVGQQVLLAAKLDRFALACLDVAGDSGDFSDASSAYAVPQIQTPTFDPESTGTDWRHIESWIVHRVQSIPIEQSFYERGIADVAQEDHERDQGATFFARQMSYAGLGLEASRLAQALRRSAGIEELHVAPGTSSLVQRLQWWVDHFAKENAQFEAARTDSAQAAALLTNSQPAPSSKTPAA
ncbi:hypothetical protein [Roseateles chitinivorans]|uniref:hypothetical protein n=1 Tax=Roseateles chitinivorans TaxID=2917965 RepID=UPI001180CCEE|nr:hypothetical protein [Roseateles chitinivorans]